MARASARRSRREGRAQRTPRSAPAYIKRNIPFYEFLGEEGLVRLEEQADWLLQEVGIEFREDPDALRIWREAGADVKDTRVRLPKGMARELCKTAPSKFTQHARNPERSVEIGETSAVFAPVYGPPFVRCVEKGRRYGTLEDFENLVKLTYMLPGLHHSGFVTCEPCDVPVNKRHLDMLYAHIRNGPTSRSLGAITEKERARGIRSPWHASCSAKTSCDDRCVIMGNVNTNSPLHVDRVVTEAIEVYCGAGQGIVVAPFILGGAMGPVTTAAVHLPRRLAEAMVCGAFSQLVRPGAPFVLGNFLSSMSLKSGAPTFGMPEPVMSNYVVGQLARRLGVPLRCGGSLTASKMPDAQAAYESADSIHSTMLAGANFILHSAGWLEGGLVTGYEKLVLDADRLAAYQVFLSGMPIDDNALARDAYLEVEPGEHFLGCAHTMANYETAYFDAVMSDSESFEQWTDNGGKDAMIRAHERWNEMLKTYEAPPMDEAKDEELKAYVAKRKEGMADAWY